MERYRFIEDLTSDVMFEAYGKTYAELFENAALAMLGVICQTDRVKRKKSITVVAEGDDWKGLMFDWLQKIISTVDIEQMFFSGIEILEIREKRLKARISGEDADPSKGGTLVKAVTKYRFDLWKEGRIFRCRAALDI